MVVGRQLKSLLLLMLVIEKYFVLRSLGAQDEQLYLTDVTKQYYNTTHMILSYFAESNNIPFIPDNYNSRILAADKGPDLLPIYRFNVQSSFLPDAALK